MSMEDSEREFKLCSQGTYENNLGLVLFNLKLTCLAICPGKSEAQDEAILRRTAQRHCPMIQ